MTRKVLLLGFLVLVCAEVCGRVLAQAPPLPSPRPTVPAVSDVTKLRTELANVVEQLALTRAQRDVCIGQLAPQILRTNTAEIATERQRIVADFELANPGYTIDLSTLKVTPKKGGP